MVNSLYFPQSKVYYVTVSKSYALKVKKKEAKTMANAFIALATAIMAISAAIEILPLKGGREWKERG